MINGNNVKTVIIENSNGIKLCKEIENFIRGKQVIDIKYSTYQCGFGTWHSALVIYCNES